MPNSLARLALAVLVALLCVCAAAAQTPAPAPEWVAVSPADEEFAALMPKEPLRLEQDVRVGELAAAGQRYTATADGGARYIVWSFQDPRNAGERPNAEDHGAGSFVADSYLDLVAEVAWELLVKPEFERLEVERLRTGLRSKSYPSISYVRMFDLNGRAAREYSLRLEKGGGPVYVSADGSRLYVAAALAPDPQASESRRFVDSFAVGTKTPAPPKKAAEPAPAQQATVAGGGPAAPGHNMGSTVPPPDPNAPVDYNRPFRQAKVTKKAAIIFKPEPDYTEGGRKFNVTGVVRLRAILSKSGEVRSISVVKYLPHGLTEKAIAALSQVRFIPAEKDGQAVSQYAVFEYNFNIY